MQIAYSQTEGYVPVTSKAQNSAEYADYLARSGEDNDKYYDIKIKASELLLGHVGETFVTPVFNGSTSLRSAAGQMIENVTKSVRRRETVDDAYFEKLYGDMTSLYRLDSIGGAPGDMTELGELPGTAVALLLSLAAAWVLIALYVIIGKIKNLKKASRRY